MALYGDRWVFYGSDGFCGHVLSSSNETPRRSKALGFRVCGSGRSIPMFVFAPQNVVFHSPDSADNDDRSFIHITGSSLQAVDKLGLPGHSKTNLNPQMSITRITPGSSAPRLAFQFNLVYKHVWQKSCTLTQSSTFYDLPPHNYGRLFSAKAHVGGRK